MKDEIRQQPVALERTLRLEASRAARLGRRLQGLDVQLVVLAARGSSDNAARFGRYLIEICTGLPVSLAAPSVHTLYRSRLRLRHAVVVGISQSGESTDVNQVVEESRKAGAFTVAITNERNSTLCRLADEVLLVRAGKERSVAATKTYTGQLLVLYLLAAALLGRDGWPGLERVPDLAQAALEREKDLAALVERYRFMDRCLVVARGLNYANAYELAIKLMETCYVVADRFSSADLLHGPVAMVEPGFPVFAFAPPGRTLRDMTMVLRRLGGLGAETIVLSGTRALLSKATSPIGMPADIPELLSPIPYVVPAQLFAACLAEVKGISPDAPRSLSKVTRTV
jgi:glucosamine--fructose-6-phosphate aminotransferase (isomerizing)